MANPTILFENIYEGITTATLTATSEASGFPVENISNWRMATAYRWKATSSSAQSIDLSFPVPSALHRDADTLVIAGHNLGTIGAAVEVFADATTIGSTSVATANPSDDLAFMVQFTNPGNKRHWRVSLSSMSDTPQIGIMAIGVRMDFEAGALFDLDPYRRTAAANVNLNNSGTPIGVNVRAKQKRFALNYGTQDPGMTRDGFFAPSSGHTFDDDFLPHAIDNAKPFFFNWNYDVDPDEVYLCTVQDYDVRMPFVGSTARRGLQATLVGYRETT